LESPWSIIGSRIAQSTKCWIGKVLAHFALTQVCDMQSLAIIAGERAIEPLAICAVRIE